MKTIWSDKKYIAHYDVPEDLIEQVGRNPTHIFFRHVISSLIRPGCSLLDIGCAAGFFYGLLMKYNVQVDYTGIDLTPELVERAKCRHPGAHFETASADSLPFGDESFDVVMSKETIFVLEDIYAGLNEALRVCRGTAVMDLILTAPGHDGKVVNTADRGRINMLGPDEKNRLLEYLSPHKVNVDYLNIGLWNQSSLGRHPAYLGMSSVRHLVLTIRKNGS